MIDNMDKNRRQPAEQRMGNADESPPGELSSSPWRSPPREWGVAALLMVVLASVGAINPAFLSAANLHDMLVHSAAVAIVACGLTLVILTGEIDISVGAAMGLLAAILGLLCSPSHFNLPVPLAVLLTLLLGTALGSFNGLLVTWGKIPSIIVTLGMLSILRGATELVMGGRWITDLPPGLRMLGTGSVFGIRISILTAIVVAATLMLLLHHTPLGRRIHAVGSNPSAARLAGLSNERIQWFTFTLTGLLVAVATVVTVPQLSVIEAGVGIGFELLVITCVVVGGTSISGGRGTLVGTLLAVALLGIVRTALIFLKLGDGAVYWERAIQGSFILLAVLADRTARRSATEMEEPS
jgi:rhamnose transport system permease protein